MRTSLSYSFTLRNGYHFRPCSFFISHRRILRHYLSYCHFIAAIPNAAAELCPFDPPCGTAERLRVTMLQYACSLDTISRLAIALLYLPRSFYCCYAHYAVIVYGRLLDIARHSFFRDCIRICVLPERDGRHAVSYFANAVRAATTTAHTTHYQRCSRPNCGSTRYTTRANTFALTAACPTNSTARFKPRLLRADVRSSTGFPACAFQPTQQTAAGGMPGRPVLYISSCSFGYCYSLDVMFNRVKSDAPRHHTGSFGLVLLYMPDTAIAWPTLTAAPPGFSSSFESLYRMNKPH